MNLGSAKKWVELLRSGKYRALWTHGPRFGEPGDDAFTAAGVLMDSLDPNWWHYRGQGFLDHSGGLTLTPELAARAKIKHPTLACYLTENFQGPEWSIDDMNGWTKVIWFIENHYPLI